MHARTHARTRPQALTQFGTDFSLMERLFPGRARRSLKNKYIKESRKDGARVDAALRGGGDAAEKYHMVMQMLQARAAACVVCVRAERVLRRVRAAVP